MLIDKEDLAYLMITLLSIPSIIYFTAHHYEIVEPEGYTITGYTTLFYLGVVVLIILLIMYLLLSYYLYLVVRITGEERTRKSAKYMLMAFIYFAGVSTVMIPAYIWFIETGISSSYTTWGGTRIYVYPVAAGIGTILAFLSLIYLFYFAYNTYTGAIPLKIKTAMFIIYLAFVYVAIQPYNYYALYPVENQPNTRPIIFIMHLLLMIFVTIFATKKIHEKTKAIDKPIQTKKLKLIMTGFLIYPLTFIPPIIWLTLYEHTPIGVWYIISYIIFLMGSIFIYLGYLTPTWLEERWKKINRDHAHNRENTLKNL